MCPKDFLKCQQNSKKSGKENGRLIFSPVNRILALQKVTTFHEYCTSFFQVASLISRDLVNTAVKKRNSGKYSKKLNTWTHLISLLFCHMADCQSLREICKGMKAIRGGLNHHGIEQAPLRNFGTYTRVYIVNWDSTPTQVVSDRILELPESCCWILVLLLCVSMC